MLYIKNKLITIIISYLYLIKYIYNKIYTKSIYNNNSSFIINKKNKKH